MSNATAISELERAEHDGTFGVKKVRAYGSDGTNLQSIKTDTNGSINIVQGVLDDQNNSSTTNLTSSNSYTFTGVGTSTLGVAGLQFNLETDQNATICIEQSDDNTNWDISDCYDYKYSKGGFGATVQAVTAYWRIRVVLTGTTDTTYFRLKGVLCPIVEALPRALNTYGRLITSGGIVDEETKTRVEVDTLGSLKTITPIRLVGTAFSGATKDTNFWTEAVTGTGSVAQDGDITLATGETADSTAKYSTNRMARKVPGASNQFKFVGRLVTAPQANNLRRCGAYGTNNGFFFQVNGTTFGVGSRKGGVDTIVNSGSFNGNYGASLSIGTTFGRFVIEYDHLSAKFFVNGVLLHTITASTTALNNTLDFPITMENNNSGGNTTDNSFEILFATILRLGELETESNYKYLGANATTVCKYGAGRLVRVVNVDNAGTVTLYDNTAGSGTQIAVIDTAKALGTLEFGLPFSTGLTAVVATGAKVVLVYE